MLEQIEKYRILDEIGQGGMSVVYRAHDETLDRHVAVKVLHQHLARDPDARERFSREARAVARLTHHNIPEIHDFSASNDALNYLVTELVTGAPLSALAREGPPMLPEVGAMICVGVCDALAHAHKHQIIHRDVKPENILVGNDGVVKLTDFGIAQIIGLESMTITGTLVGSPAHMAPEQIEGQRTLDTRADVWALGTVLYVVVTGGTLPFDATTPHGVLKKIVEGRFEDPRRINPHVNSSLAAIVNRCLQVDREKRFSAMEAFSEELVAWLAERGLRDYEDELRQWMTDPVAYNEQLAARLAVTLMALGDEERERGQRHRSLEAYGRVLTLQPDHAEALQRVRELNSGLRRGRVAKAGLGMMLAAAGVFGLVEAWPEPEPVPLPPPAVGLQLSPVGVPPAAPVLEPEFAPLSPPTVGLRTGASLAGLDAPIGRLMTAAARGSRRTSGEDGAATGAILVRLTAEPPAVTITLDGKPVQSGGILKLRAGRHKAVLTHPACSDCSPTRRTFRVPERPKKSPFHQHLRFAYKPAIVTVSCQGGTVSVDGRVYGPCGKSYRVTVLRHQPRVGKITVTLSDGSTRRRTFTVKPDARVRWVVGG